MAYNTNIEKTCLPIVTYGHKVLRMKCEEVTMEMTNLDKTINGLWNTLELTNGIGLASPQINSTSNIFVVDSKLMYNEISDNQKSRLFSGDKGIQETFINARIVEQSQDKWNDFEACLSIPGIYEPIDRPWEIIIEYQDRDLDFHRVHYSGYTARVIQHECDHNNGVLFIDYLKPIAKKLLKSKLNLIRDGKVETAYPISKT